jgi:hypothetical protein
MSGLIMSIIIMLNLQITDTFVIYPALVFLVSILFNMTDWLSSRFYEEGSTETRLNTQVLCWKFETVSAVCSLHPWN